MILRASGGIGIRAGLRETSAARLKVRSLFFTIDYESRSKIKKGLRTILSVIVDKKNIQIKMDERLKEIKSYFKRFLDRVKFLLQLLKANLVNQFMER